MVKQENESGQGIPEWLAAYRIPMDKSRAWFHYQVSELPLADGAASKFDAEGKAKAFPGLSLVTFLDPQSPAFQNLAALTEQIQREYQEAGIDDAFAFLPPSTWHITLADLVVTNDLSIQSQVKAGIEQGFEKLHKEPLAELQLYLRSDPVTSSGISVVTLAEPKREQDLREIQKIRGVIAEEFEPSLVSDTLQHPDHFIGHVTGWYFCQALDTQKYSRFKEIMQRHDLQRRSLGEVKVKNIELRRFTSMEAWGNKSLTQLKLAANS
ncbi:MAG: DUF1868 domain-containing protein [Ktedonobacteraceae bacterium]